MAKRTGDENPLAILRPIVDLRRQYELLTTLIWRNSLYNASFTKNRTDRPHRYEVIWYTCKLGSQEIEQRFFYLEKHGIYIEFGSRCYYRIVEMGMYKKGTDLQVILNMQNIADAHDYRNFLGTTKNEPIKPIIPAKRGRKRTSM